MTAENLQGQQDGTKQILLFSRRNELRDQQSEWYWRAVDVNSAIRKRCQGSIEIGILSGQGDSIVKSRRKSRRYNYTPSATNHSPVESMLRMGPNASAQDIFNMGKLTMVNLDTDT